MIGSLAAVIVQKHGLTEQFCHEDGGERGEKKRGVRGGESVNDIRPAQFLQQQRPIRQLRCDCPDILDVAQMSKRSRWRGIDWHQPAVNFGIVLPRPEHPLRLHGLASQDLCRRGDYGNVESA